VAVALVEPAGQGHHSEFVNRDKQLPVMQELMEASTNLTGSTICSQRKGFCMWTIARGLGATNDLPVSSRHEWLVTDNVGGFAMGTVSGLRTRRYHGLLIGPDPATGRRQLGLASLDPVLCIGDERIQLATHEWSGPVTNPNGTRLLSSFSIIDGVPRWRWAIGEIVLERELAMTSGRSAVGIIHRIIRAPAPIRLELESLVTWRDMHSERFGSSNPEMVALHDGFVFESAFRVRGSNFEAAGNWYRGVWYRVEAERGLNPVEDLFHAGKFSCLLAPGESDSTVAWIGPDTAAPPPAEEIVKVARERATKLSRQAGADSQIDEVLAHAADQFIVVGPDVIAGYPWFGSWSRDTMTSYEGLFLDTGRSTEGAQLLSRAADGISQGMLLNTADSGSPEYNTVDAALWFLHAVTRHVDITGDLDLAARLEPALMSVVDCYLAGTRFGIGVDPHDGLVYQGADGVALTWMDARIEDHPVTPRPGKPVEVNALWINGIAGLISLRGRLGLNIDALQVLETRVRHSFADRFQAPCGLFDVIDGPDGNSASVRPNQLLAASLPRGPKVSRNVVEACASLITPLGLRSLSPEAAQYRPRHQGSKEERDLAYHQGTVWPWLLGSYVEGSLRTGIDVEGVLDGVEAHILEFGIGSISETADGDAPHLPTGCPFQAWSVAEVIRARRLLRSSQDLFQ
jgi:predicted glycogen debranching enzyme